MKPQMKRFKGDGVRINAAVWDGEGSPILLIHGSTANCRTFDSMVPSLLSRHRVISLDLRGRGLSDKPDTGYSLDHPISDIQCVMDDIGIQSAVVMGHSLGAYITAYLAGNCPNRVDKLVMIDGGATQTREHAGLVQTALAPIWDRSLQTFPTADEYISFVTRLTMFHPWRSEIETYFRHEIEAVEGGVRCNINRGHIDEEIANLGRYTHGPEFADLYEKIECDTLIISATEGINVREDIVLPLAAAEEIKRKMPRAEVMPVKGNHFGILFNDDAEKDSAILDFIARPATN